MNWPKVSIIVTTYLEKNKNYLDLCIKSIKNLDYPKEQVEVIIVSHKSFTPKYEGVRSIAPDKEQFYNPEGLNFGVLNAAHDSEFYFILNDDTILTRDCLRELVRMSGKNKLVINALSNCNANSLTALSLGYVQEGMFEAMQNRFFRMDQVTDLTDSMMNTGSLFPCVRMPFLCMFASFIPKKVWQEVGPFDENFKTGQDDIDFSIRCAELEIPMFICLSAVVWHFGGVSADETIKLKERKENIIYFKNKWGHLPPGMPENILETLDESYKFENHNKGAM